MYRSMAWINIYTSDYTEKIVIQRTSRLLFVGMDLKILPIPDALTRHSLDILHNIVAGIIENAIPSCHSVDRKYGNTTNWGTNRVFFNSGDISIFNINSITLLKKYTYNTGISKSDFRNSKSDLRFFKLWPWIGRKIRVWNRVFTAH